MIIEPKSNKITTLKGTFQWRKKDKKTYSSTFSDGMNSTLDNMRKKYQITLIIIANLLSSAIDIPIFVL